jgi:hypothetical protein
MSTARNKFFASVRDLAVEVDERRGEHPPEWTGDDLDRWGNGLTTETAPVVPRGGERRRETRMTRPHQREQGRAGGGHRCTNVTDGSIIF